MTKQMIAIPIFWGDWWVPVHNNAYNWLDVNGMMAKVIGGRYMDGLNQYGYERGSVQRPFVYEVDPPATGFGDTGMQNMFRTAIDDGQVPKPDDFDLSTQQPFYCLFVKPGVEHLRDATADGTVAQDAPDINTGAYHFGFNYNYDDGRTPWRGQACWVKSDTTAAGTVVRWAHEMAEAYSGNSEIADRCQGNPPVLVDGVVVPQYWSVTDNTCWPPDDTWTTVEEAQNQAAPSIGGSDPMETVDQALSGDGPHIGRLSR